MKDEQVKTRKERMTEAVIDAAKGLGRQAYKLTSLKARDLQRRTVQKQL